MGLKKCNNCRGKYFVKGCASIVFSMGAIRWKAPMWRCVSCGELIVLCSNLNGEYSSQTIDVYAGHESCRRYIKNFNKGKHIWA